MDPQHELAHILLRKASADLVMARCLMGDSSSPDWGIGFHVQQAVEKALKAILCAHGIEYPRTHNISLLLDMLAEQNLVAPVARAQLIYLTPFGCCYGMTKSGPAIWNWSTCRRAANW
ncbi:MAG: HEPN domain-containing protein [Phycisphaerae bacterium]